jgi:hypothetical protein
VTENPLYGMIRSHVPGGANLLHIVGFKFPEAVSEEQQADLMSECAALKENCGGEAAGIKSLIVQKNADPRKGYAWVEVMVFENADAFAHFHAHPTHQAFGKKASQVAEVWVVLDVAIEPASLKAAR